MNEKQLKEAAKNLNEVIKPEPPLDPNMGNTEQLAAEVKEVGMMLEGGDEVLSITAEVLKELGCVLHEDVKIINESAKIAKAVVSEEKPVVKSVKEEPIEVKAKKVDKVEAKEKEEKEVKVMKEKKVAKKVAAKAKPKPVEKKVVKAVAKVKKVAKVKGAKGWKEGSSAQIIFEAAQKLQRNITAQAVVAKVKGAFKSSNAIGRVKLVLQAAAKNGWLSKAEDGTYSVV